MELTGIENIYQHGQVMGLTDEQINLIKNATDKQKLLAMEMVSFSSLEGKNYTNFCHNVRRLIRK